MDACWACSVRCKKVVKLEQPYQIDPKYGGPEFESIAAMGSDCGIGDLAVVAKANERCNALGVDTISFGATVAWAIDLQRRGILANAEVDGVPLEFGSGKALLATLEAIAKREGLGDVLAEGSARAAERLGGKEFLTTVKGLEIAMHDPRQVTKPHVTGPLSKVRLDQDDLAGQIRAYYAARGWNEQGVPLPETLSRLQIAEYA